jgi:transcriptional regulator with XRE-family HTH domain
MTGTEAVKQAMHDAGITQTQLAKLIGVPGQSTISEYFKRDMKISLVAKMCEAMGYELVIQKKKPGKRSSGQIVIGGDDQ